MKRATGCCFVLVVASVLPMVAQQPDPTDEPPMITDRPDFTESTATVPRLQLESGYTFARVGEEEQHAIGELLLRLPLAHNVELRLGVNSLAVTRTPEGNVTGLEDSSLGMKLSLREQGGEGSGILPAIALLVSTTLPTGASEFGEETLQPEAKVAVGWDVSDRVGLSSNAGYAHAHREGERVGEYSGSLSVGIGLTERLGSYLEAYGFVFDGGGTSNTSFLNGGLTYLLTDDTQIDARTGIGMNSAEPDYFLGLGLSRRW